MDSGNLFRPIMRLRSGRFESHTKIVMDEIQKGSRLAAD